MDPSEIRNDSNRSSMLVPLLTTDATGRPGDRLQPLPPDLLIALEADTIRKVIDTIDSSLNLHDPIMIPDEAIGGQIHLDRRRGDVVQIMQVLDHQGRPASLKTRRELLQQANQICADGY
jgi:hypothetical protein